jgi:hypothetical protein
MYRHSLTCVSSHRKLGLYVVTKKRTGWGAEYAPEKRNGEWESQGFNADKSVNDT